MHGQKGLLQLLLEENQLQSTSLPILMGMCDCAGTPQEASRAVCNGAVPNTGACHSDC